MCDKMKRLCFYYLFFIHIYLFKKKKVIIFNIICSNDNNFNLSVTKIKINPKSLRCDYCELL